MNIYEAIKKDHQIQRDLCDKLMKTEEDPSDRKDIYGKLRKELKVHEIAEERNFYKPLISTEEMIEDARHGMAEHHEMDEVIEKLDDTHTDSDTWFSLAEQLCETVEHHLKDEEEKFFGKSKKIYTEEEAEELGKKYVEAVDKLRSEYVEEHN